METVKFIKENGLAAIKEQLAVEVKKYPGFFILNYNQLDSPSTHPVVQECRGLMLTDDLEVVCKSFSRFFNYGETPQITGKMKYENALAFTKIDGSLLVVYFNQVTNTWEAATRNAAYAEGQEKTLQYTVKDLALIALNEPSIAEFAKKSNLDPSLCYIFELTSPYTKVVKAYADTRMSLLTIVPKNGPEFKQDAVDSVFKVMASHSRVFRPELIVLKNEQHLKELLTKCTGLDEGFVVLNEEIGLRVKAKSQGYLAAAHLKTKGNEHVPARAATLVATGEHIEWLSYNAEDEELFKPYMHARDWLKTTIHEVYKDTKDITDAKALAAIVGKYPFSSLFFRGLKEQKHPWDLYLEQDSRQQAKLILQAVCKVTT